MPPVEFIENQVEEGTTRIRFVRNTPYEGTDYGPDYETDVAFVESRQAAIWIQKGRAVAIETSDESSDEIKSKLDALTEKLPELSVGQIAKNRKDVLVACAFDLGLPTVPDDMSNNKIAQLIYDHVHGKSE